MWGNKCPNCAKKIKQEFNFCPYCGLSFKQHREQEDFGMLGRDDFADLQMPPIFSGLDKIMGPLMKQLIEQFGKETGEVSKQPRGLKIQITAKPPQTMQKSSRTMDEKEVERRRGLPKKEAESNVRRLSDKVVYEIDVPGVKSKDEVMITKLENSIEIKAYSDDACYTKNIPLKVDVLGYRVKDGRIVLELKS